MNTHIAPNDSPQETPIYTPTETPLLSPTEATKDPWHDALLQTPHHHRTSNTASLVIQIHSEKPELDNMTGSSFVTDVPDNSPAQLAPENTSRPSSSSETSSSSEKSSCFERSFSSSSRSDQPPELDIAPALDHDCHEITTETQINAVASKNLMSEVGPYHDNDGNNYDIYQNSNASGTKCMSNPPMNVFGGR